jgi:hypothetical protein
MARRDDSKAKSSCSGAAVVDVLNRSATAACTYVDVFIFEKTNLFKIGCYSLRIR